MMSPEELAHELAVRLASAVPASVRVEAQGPAVAVGNAEGFLAWTELNLFAWDSPDDLARVCERVLDHVQDFVMEETTELWQGTPNAEVSGEEIRLWYGDGENPSLALPPIPLT